MVFNYSARPSWRRIRSLKAEPIRWRRQESLGLANTPPHVVIVMDGLKDFTTEALEWALWNIASAGATVTLMGLMPWLNIPLSWQTWRDLWMLELEDVIIAKERGEWKNDTKYFKLQAVMELCEKYGVLLKKEVVMGYPPRALVANRILKLQATWVVFDDSDKYHKRSRKFYEEKIPCNMVIMNEEGGVDMIKGCQMIDNGSTPGESPASLVPTPELMISERLKVILEEHESESGDIRSESVYSNKALQGLIR